MPGPARWYVKVFVKAIIFLSVFSVSISLSIFYWPGIEKKASSVYDSILNELDSYLLNHGFGVKKIVVSGNKLIPTRAIENMIPKHKSTLFISSYGIVKAATYTEGLIKYMSVSKQFPDTIKIRVSEYMPFVILCNNNKKECNVIDENSHIIAPSTESDLTKLVKVSGNVITKKDLIMIKGVLSDNFGFANRIAEFKQIGKRRWNILFKGGTVLELPQKNPIEAWGRFLEIQNNPAVRSYGIIDMRASDRIFFKRTSK